MNPNTDIKMQICITICSTIIYAWLLYSIPLSQDGMNALQYACKYGHQEIVQLLIDYKANVAIKDFVSLINILSG